MLNSKQSLFDFPHYTTYRELTSHSIWPNNLFQCGNIQNILPSTVQHHDHGSKTWRPSSFTFWTLYPFFLATANFIRKCLSCSHMCIHSETSREIYRCNPDVQQHNIYTKQTNGRKLPLPLISSHNSNFCKNKQIILAIFFLWGIN
jgi:hypothetical protein